MPRTAFALSIIFILLAVGWRSWVHYRRTGDIGLRRPSETADLLEKTAGGLLVIGAVGLLLSPVCAMAGLAMPLRALDRSAVQGLGLVFSWFGMGMTVLAEFQMGDSWRVGVDPSEATSLVQDGLFACIRNPIYSGMILFALGVFSLVPNPVSVAAGLIFLIGVQLQVRGVEEPYLTRKHGRSYDEYARATGRFAPWIGRLR